MTTAPSLPAPPGQPLRRPIGWALTETLALTSRNLAVYVRVPQLLFFTVVQPVVMVVLLSQVYGGVIRIPGHAYLEYLLPGVLVQTVMLGAAQTAGRLAEDLSQGVIDRLQVLPISRAAVLAGRILADTVRNLFAMLVMVGVGAALGFRFHAGGGAAVAAVLLTAGFGLAYSWVTALIGLRASSVDVAITAAAAPLYPLYLASSAFVPVATMPAWLRTVAAVNPVTVVVDGVRALSLGGAMSPVIAATALIVGLHAVFVPLAVCTYRSLGDRRARG